MYLVGNGIDEHMHEISKREVTFEEGADYSDRNGFIGFMETSAKTGYNVE